MNLPSEMRALALVAPGQLELVRRPVPRPAPGHVVVRTRAATICTSDLHDIRDNPFGIVYPRVLGHEAAGVVASCGEGVTGLRPGDGVAAHPVVPCGECPECHAGHGHLCRRMGHLGLDREGAFAEFFEQRADRVRKLPEGLSASAGSLLEPLCVCLQALARAGGVTGRNVLIVGDGPFGVLIARLAVRDRAARVLLAGHSSFRSAQAPGAITVLSREVGETAEEVRAQCGGVGVDAAILAVSSEEALALCVAAVRPRGRVVLFSAPRHAAGLDLMAVHVRELELVGSCNDEERLDEALALLGDPSLRISSLVTHHIPFDNWPEAFRLAHEGHDEALKVALTFSEA